MIELQFLGAARGVTGSKHLLRTSRAAVLLDCGLFQGRRQESFEKNRHLPFDAGSLDAVVLSHAHIDHSGALPMLIAQGYRGPIFATPATRDLCAPMLMDAAAIQLADAKHIERLIAHERLPLAPVQPLYGMEQVRGTLEKMVGLPYRQSQQIAPGVTLSFLDAGHVLGSAICVLDVEDEGRQLRLAYTGDLGRKQMPILRDPEVPEGVQCLITESTYGDRLHPPIAAMNDDLAEAVGRTVARGGKVVVPSFALERAQEVVFALKQLRAQGRLPKVPVFIDSPLTVRLTEVFKLHPECFDEETFALLQGADSPFDFPGLRYVSSAEDSMAIDALEGPAIVISASGMCEAGRVLHHLRATIEEPRNTVLIVGFQAEHTLGRRLVERRPEVRIFGVSHRRAAEVVVLNGFSAHADRQGLVEFAEEVRRQGQLGPVILVHGEPRAQEALGRALHERDFSRVEVPAPGATFAL